MPSVENQGRFPPTADVAPRKIRHRGVRQGSSAVELFAPFASRHAGSSPGSGPSITGGVIPATTCFMINSGSCFRSSIAAARARLCALINFPTACRASAAPFRRSAISLQRSAFCQGSGALASRKSATTSSDVNCGPNPSVRPTPRSAQARSQSAITSSAMKGPNPSIRLATQRFAPPCIHCAKSSIVLNRGDGMSVT